MDYFKKHNVAEKLNTTTLEFDHDYENEAKMMCKYPKLSKLPKKSPWELIVVFVELMHSNATAEHIVFSER
jgi:hypothetical protein